MKSKPTFVRQTLSAVGIILSFSLQAIAAEEPTQSTQPAYEMSCRIKAKEIAAETYRSCVVDSRKSLIDKIRTDYQSKLKSLKEEYEGELSGLSGNRESQSEPKSKKSAAKANSRVASSRGLPGKNKALRETSPSVNSEDLSVQLRRSNNPPQGFSDDSVMDIPEPIPVESVQSRDSEY